MGRLGAFCGRLGVSWGRPGGVLAASCGVLWRLVASWAVVFENVEFSIVFQGFRAPRRVLEASREGLGGVVGRFGGRLGGVLGRLGGVLACLGGVLCRRGSALILLFVVF